MHIKCVVFLACIDVDGHTNTVGGPYATHVFETLRLQVGLPVANKII